VRLDASKERLATLFGVARPSLSRELGELQRRGLVEVRGRTIAILDPAGLMRLKAH
jgi:CRP-like cAMP-binding protein